MKTKTGLPKANEWMFETIEASSYLKPIKDGKFIDRVNDDFFYVENDPTSPYGIKQTEIPWEDFGGGNFIKTLYEDTKMTFRGIVIGIKLVTVTEYLFADVQYGYDDSEHYFVNREPIEQKKCLVVAYGCNRTRLVPIESAKEVTYEQ